MPILSYFNFQKYLCLEIILQEFFRLAIDAMAKNSLRCVAIACRTQELNKVPNEQEDLDKWDLPEDELTLLAIVGIKDPCRPGVREAVRICTSAGVKVSSFASIMEVKCYCNVV